MPWTVGWEPEIEDDLTDFWLKSSDRAAVTRARAQIDETLAKSPLSRAEEISEGLFSLAISPLIVVFEISEPEKLIKVTGIGIEDQE